MPFRKSSLMDSSGTSRWLRGGEKSWRGASMRKSGPISISTRTTWSKLPRPRRVRWPREPLRNYSKGRPPCSGRNSLVRRVNGSVRWIGCLGPFSSGGPKSNTVNRSATARLAAAIFFPQRPGLRLTSQGYSPSVLEKIVRSECQASLVR